MEIPDGDDRMKPNEQPTPKGGFAPQRSEGLIEQSGQRYGLASAVEPPPVAHHAAGSGAGEDTPPGAAGVASAPPSRRSYEELRGYFVEHFGARRRDAAAVSHRERNFAHAEPNYHAGYDAGIDLRYDGCPFEEIEPELRHEYVTRAQGMDPAGPVLPEDEATWRWLREEIRCGFDAARAS